MSDMNRRSMPLFSMGIVMELTDLTARQIRYYEDNNLVQPARTKGNRRLFSFNDVDRLLEIKELIEKGVNLAGIKEMFAMKQGTEKEEIVVENEPAFTKDLSDKELREMLRKELFNAGRLNNASLRQGELSRFFH
ncbi:MerR family transcriptional regulator [Salirhabdus sp. Marseille-P4669]|uniref:MerR family transcriptional regulator n=1 Tax=Salirhabdus sp. Marseille-P4669 TaxID=2042310 RepID=UPI000C7A3FE5|nr:MerR family transcriptional regulator [Salirhabdus sp. Marseille-P4669]